jgi:hypothetical protein
MQRKTIIVGSVPSVLPILKRNSGDLWLKQWTTPNKSIQRIANTMAPADAWR